MYVVCCIYAYSFLLQFESSWIITNIASGSSEHTRAVVNAGAVLPLINLLNHSDHAISDQVCLRTV